MVKTKRIFENHPPPHPSPFRKKKWKSKQKKVLYELLVQIWVSGRLLSLVWYAMLTQVMNDGLPGSRVVLKSCHKIVPRRSYWQKLQHPWKLKAKFPCEILGKKISKNRNFWKWKISLDIFDMTQDIHSRFYLHRFRGFY